MDAMDITLRVIGVFYALGGYAAARSALTSNLIDRAIAALTLKRTERIETHRTIWLLFISMMFVSGGVCLALLLKPAAWIFAFATLVQAVFFLGLGPYYFDVADPPEPGARQRSINAFVIFSACTFLTLWAAYLGRLTPLREASLPLWGTAAVVIALHAGYIFKHTLLPPKRQGTFGGFDVSEASGDNADDGQLDFTGPPSSSKRIKVMADYGTFPLWAMDDGLMGDFAPEDLGASDALSESLWAWANEFEASLNPDDPANSKWSTERHLQHIEEGVALARRIKQELPEREVFVRDGTGNLIEIAASGTAET